MNEGLILNSQELSEFEKEMANLGIIEAKPDNDSSKPLKNNGQLSLSEERAWMLHQQGPLSSAGPFTAAFKLSGELDILRLARALKNLYQNDSSLNQVYKLDDEGELIKQRIDIEKVEIETLSYQTDEEIINFLLEQQGTPIDLACQTAIKFWLFAKANDEVVLGFLGHHILLDDSAWKPMFMAISTFYKGLDLFPISASKITEPALMNGDVIEKYWLDNHPNGFSRTDLPSLFVATEQQYPSINNVASKHIITFPLKARRFFTHISPDKENSLAEAAQASSFQTLLTLFGLYLNQLLNRKAVDILIPTVDHQEITQLNQIKSSSNVIPVSIENSDKTILASIIELRNNLLNGLGNKLSIEQIFSVTKTRRNNLPNILVTQVDEASDYLDFEGITVTNLAIPPLASDYDITLAIQFEVDGKTKLELTTGNVLSPTIGAFLLEQFVVFIEKSEIDSTQVLSSLFSSETKIKPDPAQTKAFELTPNTPHNQDIVDAILAEFKVVLDGQDVTEQDDFFELGGHSLLATRVIGKLKTQHQIDVKIADFFNTPTVLGLAGVANYLNEEFKEAPSIYHDKEIIVPHSYIQNTYMELIELGRNPIFNIPFVLKFSEAVDEQAFHKAFADVILRHHALRTLLLPDADEGVLQRIITASSINDYQWFYPSTTQGELSAETLLSNEANYSFDLINELPLRVRFAYNNKGEHFLSLLIYHMTFDEWSTGVLISDLFHAYKHYAAGNEVVWQTTPNQFHQFVLEQRRSNTIEQDLAFWKKYLGKVPPAKAIFQHEDSNIVPSSEGSWLEFSFDRSIADGLNQLAKTNKSSMFHVVYSAFALAMYYLGAGKKVLVATSAFGRDDPKYQDTVGLFTNVLLNHVHFDEALEVNQLVKQVKDNIITTLPYSDVPFVTIEHAVAANPEALAIDNLCEVYVQYHQKNILNTAIELGDNKKIDFEMLEPDRNIAKFGLHFEAYEDPYSEDATFRVVLAYRVSNYSKDQIELIKDTSKAVIQALATAIDKSDLTLRDIRKSLANNRLNVITDKD